MSGERRYRPPYTSTHHYSGFSLLEMMAVISLILIVATFSMPIYHTIVVRAREATLRVATARFFVSWAFLAPRRREGIHKRRQFSVRERRPRALQIHGNQKDSLRSSQPMHIGHHQIFAPNLRRTHDTQIVSWLPAQTFQQTVQTLKDAGFVENMLDYLDYKHPGKLDLRDTNQWCSAHVDVTNTSIPNGGQPPAMSIWTPQTPGRGGHISVQPNT